MSSQPVPAETETRSSKLTIGFLPDEDPLAPAGQELLRRWEDWIDVTEVASGCDTSTFRRAPDGESIDVTEQIVGGFDEIDGLVLPEPGTSSGSPEALSQSLVDVRDLPTITWGSLSDETERDHFFERALGRRRIRLLFHPSWSEAELTAFNTRERHRVIAHDPKRHRLMGRLVSKARDHARPDVEREIRELYLGALAKPVTRRKHVNVLENAAEILEVGSTTARNETMKNAIQAYATGGERLWPVLEILRAEALVQGLIGLARQSYLDPDPLERALRFA